MATGISPTWTILCSILISLVGLMQRHLTVVTECIDLRF
ncbi:Uncharacterised protein [Vibrio cholerae]|nr:Uncharacterised protein [Vibrio cholerae]